MDYETEMLLGAAFDDELAGIEDELAACGYEDDLGDAVLDEEGAEVGAFGLPSFLRRRRLPARRRGVSSTRRNALIRRRANITANKRAYINKIQPAIPGVPQAGARNFPLGFGSETFINAGPTAFDLVANPQRPFKGARLVIDVRRSAGALAELITVTSLNIGQNNQLVSSAALPAEAFRPDGFDTVLSLDPATPGIAITLGIAISASPGVGETIAISAMIIGDTIG